VIIQFYVSHHLWDDKHVPPCPPFFPLKWDLVNFFDLKPLLPISAFPVVWDGTILFFSGFFVVVVVLGGGTLWHLQKGIIFLKKKTQVWSFLKIYLHSGIMTPTIYGIK
jgi:hypothetical protein